MRSMVCHEAEATEFIVSKEYLPRHRIEEGEVSILISLAGQVGSCIKIMILLQVRVLHLA